MKHSPKTTVIIACYNAERWLHKLLYILSLEPCQIIIVDDDSRDTTWEILGFYDWPGWIRSSRNELNLGFAATNNIGAWKSETPYILFLNQDTEPHPGFIKIMESRMRRRKRTAIVGAKLVFPESNVGHIIFRDKVVHLPRIKGRLDHAGIDLNKRFLPLEVGRNRPPVLPEFNRSRMYPAVTGACLMIKREVFDELNGFHEGFINGWEDTDLCLRAWEAGYEIWYDPGAVVDHYHSTTDARFACEDENVDLWIERWHKDNRLMQLAEKYKEQWER